MEAAYGSFSAFMCFSNGINNSRRGFVSCGVEDAAVANDCGQSRGHFGGKSCSCNCKCSGRWC